VKTYTATAGRCENCNRYSPDLHRARYAGGGDDTVRVCCDCMGMPCDEDCDGRIPQVCANCGASGDDLPPRCPDLRADFVGGINIMVDVQDAPRRVV
jgi:hypothetical protein